MWRTKKESELNCIFKVKNLEYGYEHVQFFKSNYFLHFFTFYTFTTVPGVPVLVCTHAHVCTHATAVVHMY